MNVTFYKARTTDGERVSIRPDKVIAWHMFKQRARWSEKVNDVCDVIMEGGSKFTVFQKQSVCLMRFFETGEIK